MPTSARLRLCDLRAVHLLVGECRELGDDRVLWRQHLLAGVARLAGSAVAVEYEGEWAPFRIVGAVDWGWENGLDRRYFEAANAEFVRTGCSTPMMGPYLAAVERGGGPALTRADILPDADWYRSAYYRDYQGSSGADAMMYCANQRTAAGWLSGLALVRPTRESDFAPRARSVVQEAYAAVVPLIGGPLAGFDDPSPADLPPRVRAVLRCLLEGDSDKQIAARLRISRYTVNQYTKALYRHFEVSARSELLARWVRRGWGGRFAWADGLEQR
jgi:DNA-binding CsgD family transcriptional regulator